MSIKTDNQLKYLIEELTDLRESLSKIRSELQTINNRGTTTDKKNAPKRK